MATVQDLKDAYIAATGTYPSRFDTYTGPVTEQDIINVQNAYGGGTAAGTSSGGTVTPQDILAIFNQYGVTAETGNETADQRAQRIADAINSGQRTLAEVTTTIQGISSGSIPNLGNPNAVTAGNGQALNGVPGEPEVWQDSDSGQFYLVYYVPGTNIPLRYTISEADLQAGFGPDQQIVVTRSLTSGQIDSTGALNFGSATELANISGDPFDEWANTVDKAAAVRPWLRDPEVLGLIAEAMLEHPDTGVSAADFEQTNWWRSHNDAQRQWMLLYESDPASAQQQILDYQSQVKQTLELAGMANPPQSAIEYIANKWVTGDWSDTMTQQQIRGLADPSSGVTLDAGLSGTTSGQALDTAASRTEDVRTLVAQWLGPVYGNWSDAQINDWAGRLRNNPDAKDELTGMLRKQRLALFPNYTNENLTYEDIASPWRNYMTNLWGQQADETDPIFTQILGFNDITQAGQLLRKEGLSRGIGTVVNQLQSDVLNSFGGQVRAGI